MLRLRGTPASPGVAVGRVHLVGRRDAATPRRHLAAGEVERELERFRAALGQVDGEFDRIKRKLIGRAGAEEPIAILEAHQALVHDEHLAGAAEKLIRAEAINSEWALGRTADELKRLFDEIDDEYLRQRRSDVDYLADHILRALTGQAEPPPAPGPKAVVVAADLSPADLALLHRAGIAGLATEVGGRASHLAIVARSLGIPAVVGVPGLMDRAGGDEGIIVDGLRGEVTLDPGADAVRDAETRWKRYILVQARYVEERDRTAETLDGRRVRLWANVDLPQEVAAAVREGCEGIGLYRTEYLFMSRPDLPSEDEHFRLAREAIEELGGRPATFRTCDLGADKIAAALPREREPNPALGLRSIRLCLRERPMFLAQLAGLLRASAFGPMRILFPLVSSVEELQDALGMVEQARASLRARGLPSGDDVAIGVMIETPASAAIADLLARHCSFMSIGTNDLIQYALAVDRQSESQSHLFTPLHPAILRFVRQVVEAGARAGREVTLCGEMAADPLVAALLVGLGLTDLSMSPYSVPRVKRALRQVASPEAADLARAALEADTAHAVEALVRERLGDRLQPLLDEERGGGTPTPPPVTPR